MSPSYIHDAATEAAVIYYSIPIGRPLRNYKCCILDEYLQEVVLNQIGELYIGGCCVFSGYLKPELTAEVLAELSPHPPLESDNKSKRYYYKSGDLVKLNKDGDIVFIGGKDFQIKLRGQRIDVDKIESIIMNSLENWQVQNCIVKKVRDELRQEDYLVAYVHPVNNELEEHVNEKHIKNYCHQRLPAYIAPSYFVLMDQFPLNQNDIVDRKELSLPDFSRRTLMAYSQEVN
ncbi:unnamed protein product [Didymodactylos carnosus]|uniref:AMP-binding enzyme C-terminal domain-containing protein n=1 Tax=Didymodactylos carnosus TaxID=1234261 RepID=A0A8S2JZC3_9BILA|nr:unnamed protein product [Didymodactylos carnosus]CAF3820852.1 unnamed protein product [Didymodactylos carnosus]